MSEFGFKCPPCYLGEIIGLSDLSSGMGDNLLRDTLFYQGSTDTYNSPLFVFYRGAGEIVCEAAIVEITQLLNSGQCSFDSKKGEVLFRKLSSDFFYTARAIRQETEGSVLRLLTIIFPLPFFQLFSLYWISQGDLLSSFRSRLLFLDFL